MNEQNQEQKTPTQLHIRSARYRIQLPQNCSWQKTLVCDRRKEKPTLQGLRVLPYTTCTLLTNLISVITCIMVPSSVRAYLGLTLIWHVSSPVSRAIRSSRNSIYHYLLLCAKLAGLKQGDLIWQSLLQKLRIMRSLNKITRSRSKMFVYIYCLMQ